MINAYILIAMQPGDYEKAIQSMRKIDKIAKISIVAGDYDIIVRAQVDDLEQLLQVTDNIQMIECVKRTTTQVIEKELSV